MGERGINHEEASEEEIKEMKRIVQRQSKQVPMASVHQEQKNIMT